jgi:hypothetical protein
MPSLGVVQRITREIPCVINVNQLRQGMTITSCYSVVGAYQIKCIGTGKVRRSGSEEDVAARVGCVGGH